LQSTGRFPAYRIQPFDIKTNSADLSFFILFLIFGTALAEIIYQTENQTIWKIRIDIAAKRHKIHKNNNLNIGISISYGRQKYKFGLFTRPSEFKFNKIKSERREGLK